MQLKQNLDCTAGLSNGCMCKEFWNAQMDREEEETLMERVNQTGKCGKETGQVL